MKLPPTPDFKLLHEDDLWYDSSQMQAYAIAVAEAVKAECVRLCEREGRATGFACADAIKSLEIEP